MTTLGYRVPLLAVVIVTSLLTLPVRVSSQCTDKQGCSCFDGFVSCNGLTTLPTSYPEDTKTITITNSAADEIPANVFSTLPILENIEIYSSNITTIPRGAFGGLAFAEYISLNEVRVDRIESGAFSNITDVGTLAVYISAIGTIESEAFSNIFALDALNIFMLNVTTIETNAFNNIEDAYEINFYSNNVTSMQESAFNNVTHTSDFNMYLNFVGNLGCNSVVSVIQHAKYPTFYSNIVDCTCELTWVLDSPVLKRHLFSNFCRRKHNKTQQIEWDVMSREKLGCDVSAQSACVIVPEVATKSPSIESTTVTISSSETLPVKSTDSNREVTTVTVTLASTQRSTTIKEEQTDNTPSTTGSLIYSTSESTSAVPSSTDQHTTKLVSTSTTSSILSEKHTSHTPSSEINTSARNLVTSRSTQTPTESPSTSVPLSVKPSGENLHRESSTIPTEIKTPTTPTGKPSSEATTAQFLTRTDSSSDISSTEDIPTVTFKHLKENKDETNTASIPFSYWTMSLTVIHVVMCNIFNIAYV